jgi:hypothetical protein
MTHVLDPLLQDAATSPRSEGNICEASAQIRRTLLLEPPIHGSDCACGALGGAGQCRDLIVFRISGTDAKLLAPEFHPIEANALADQLPFSAWLRRAACSGHFPIKTASAMALPRGRLATVIAQSRRNFGRNSEAHNATADPRRQ